MLLRILKESWILWGLVTAGLLIRLYQLEGLSLYNDEITTSVRIGHPFWETIALLRHSPFPPLYYAILNLWTALFGNSEWALRFPSAVFSTLTIVAVYKLGRELFNKNAGLIAASLTAFSAFAVHYAQFAKMYALFWMLSSLSFLFFFRFLKDPSHKPWLGYVVTSILCCYTMYLGYVLLLTQNLIFMFMGERARWKKWFKGQLVILAVCLPWVVWFLCSPHETWDASLKSSTFNYLNFLSRSFFVIIGSAQEIWTVEEWSQFAFKLNIWKVNLFLYIFLIVFFLAEVLGGLFKNVKAPSAPAGRSYLLCWVAFSAAIYFVYAVFFLEINPSSRYLGFLQVPLLLLVGSQIDAFKRPIKAILIALLLVMTIANTHFYFRDSLKYPRQDWRSFTRDLAQVLREDDVVLSILGIGQLKYYYKGDTSRFVKVTEAECSTQFLEKKGILNPNAGSVVILYRKRTPPDIRLEGFYLDQKALYGSVGFLRFKRVDP